jgi:hypothetical protein
VCFINWGEKASRRSLKAAIFHLRSLPQLRWYAEDFSADQPLVLFCHFWADLAISAGFWSKIQLSEEDSISLKQSYVHISTLYL